MNRKPGMGTLLRKLIYQLDKDVDRYYESEGVAFRARFYPIYRRLLELGACPMRELLLTTGTTFPALSQTIRQMEELELVCLEAGADKREKTVSLSGKAKQLAPQLEVIWKRIEKAHQQLDEEIGMKTYEVLFKFTSALEEKSLLKRINAVAHEP